MSGFDVAYTGLLNKKVTISIDRKYTDTYKKIDNKYVQRGLELVDQNRLHFEQEMVKWRDAQFEAERRFRIEKNRYFGCRGLYGIIWYIIQGNPDTVFTDVTLGKWLKVPRTTIFYHVKKMVEIGHVVKLKRGFKAAE